MLKRFADGMMRAPEDGAGAGDGGADAAAAAAAAAAATAAAAAAATAAAADKDGQGDGKTTPPAEGSKWFQDAKRFSNEHQTWLAGKGLTTDDPMASFDKLVTGWHGAEKLLGKGAEALMDRPKQGQSQAEWMAENRALFGLPDKPEAYEIKRPEMPKEMTWNEGLETGVRAIAHKHGISSAALQELTESYFGMEKARFEEATADLANSTAEMMTALETSWGAKAPAKLQGAKAAMAHFAQAAGLDESARSSAFSVLASKIGDANVVKIFAEVSEKMGNDQIGEILSMPGAGLAGTPDAARAELAAINADGSAYRKALDGNDKQALKDWEIKRVRLQKIIAGVAA